MQKLSAFVVGATGEIGKELIGLLAVNGNFTRVVVMGRRTMDLNGEKYSKVEQVVVDFEKLDQFASKFEGLDVGYCCLGTTRGKSGAAGFVRVDHDYVLATAKLAKQGGCQQFHLVTAQGSNKNSWFLYPKTKGQVEEEVTKLGFKHLAIYRPALLLCDRQERRLLEKCAQSVVGALDRWGKVSIPTTLVAQAMIADSLLGDKQKAVDIIEHAKIWQLAKQQM